VIQLYHVTMQYPSGIEALREVNLRLHEGEFVFVAGRSGAGKSTLMKLMGAELVPTSGQILVAGRNLGVLRRSQVPYFRRGLGIVWQDFRLLPDRTVTENVALPLEVLGLSRRKIALRVAQVLELVGMEQYAEARALFNEPSIILADEPTGNLDPDLAYEVVQMLRDVQSRGTTVVVATHNTALLELFNERVVLLNKGFVIEDEGGEPVAAPPSDPEALQ